MRDKPLGIAEVPILTGDRSEGVVRNDEVGRGWRRIHTARAGEVGLHPAVGTDYYYISSLNDYIQFQGGGAVSMSWWHMV